MIFRPKNGEGIWSLMSSAFRWPISGNCLATIIKKFEEKRSFEVISARERKTIDSSTSVEDVDRKRRALVWKRAVHGKLLDVQI